MSPDPALVRVYVDAHPVDVPRPATVLDAVTRADSGLAAGVRRGTHSVTDSRGLPIAADMPLESGAILRIVPVRERQE